MGPRPRTEAESGSYLYVLVVLRGPVDAGLEIARTGEIVTALSFYLDLAIACVYMEEGRYSTGRVPFSAQNHSADGIPKIPMLAVA